MARPGLARPTPGPTGSSARGFGPRQRTLRAAGRRGMTTAASHCPLSHCEHRDAFQFNGPSRRLRRPRLRIGYDVAFRMFSHARTCPHATYARNHACTPTPHTAMLLLRGVAGLPPRLRQVQGRWRCQRRRPSSSSSSPAKSASDGAKVCTLPVGWINRSSGLKRARAGPSRRLPAHIHNALHALAPTRP